jgi:hypothetical protein
MKKVLISILMCSLALGAGAQSFNGLDMGMGNLSRLSKAKTRSISPENFTGEPGKGGMADPYKEGDKHNYANSAHQAGKLGQGWKVNPYIRIGAGQTFTLAEIDGAGAIQHIWMTPTGNWRRSIIRFYWDDEKEPSVECPVGDFFCSGWGEYAPLSSLAVCVNPGSAFNCYWQMPFRKKCRITMENIDHREMTLYYQINYTLTEVPEDAAYFHAQYRQSYPTRGAEHVLVDGIKGQGHYVGTYIAWQVNNNGWWGEGELKFFIDDDKKFPTICTTGTEDYFCGSYNFDVKGRYAEFCTPYAGMHQVIRPDGLYRSQQRFGLYRWHIMDPVRFEKGLRVTIQDLGWRDDGRYLDQQSSISSVVFWYQADPHAKYPKLPTRDEMELP